VPSRLTRAALAAVLAAVLLSGSGTTLASWSDAEHRTETAIHAGALAVNAVSSSTVVLRGSQQLPASAPLVPGDVVRTTSTVQVTARGNALSGTLALSTTAAQTFAAPTVTVTSPLPGAGTNRWRVTPAQNGARATAVVDLTVPATRDGRAPAADRSNWWGSSLQNTTLDASAVRWTLTQEMP
jgi:alternate signal-mediated exported protein